MTRPITVSSVLSCSSGRELTATPEGAWDVKTIGNERRETEIAVVMGVDTHLDSHVGVAVDHLGRRLGKAGVPTPAKGYEKLLRWAEGFKDCLETPNRLRFVVP